VEVHYEGTLDNGEVFDASRPRGAPLSFKVGAGTVIKGFDLCVMGLPQGGTRKLKVEAADAYGEVKEEMIIKVPKANAPEGLTVGAMVQLGGNIPAVVTAVDEESVTIDANSPLAGKPLTFEVEVMKIVKGNALMQATFGMGCFWGPELRFQRVPGVISTIVGYSQGATSPEETTYEKVCSGMTGHNEVVQVTYDQTEVSYDVLLDVFFQGHNPTQLNGQGNDMGSQYRSGIYCHNGEQLAAAKAGMDKWNKEKYGGKIVSEIEEINNFVEAEDYHQGYLAKGGRNGRAQDASKGCNDPIRCYG